MSFFDTAFEIVVGVEGGYVNDPKDPGGETKFGLSKRANPDLDIANLTVDSAKPIYSQRYWMKFGCSTMPWVEALLVFDCVVNGGPALHWHALFKGQSALQFAIDFQAEHLLYLSNLANWSYEKRGWTRRLLTVFNQSQKVPAP